MTQTFRPVLIGLLPALAVALLLALLLAGRPMLPMNPVIDLPGIGITPTAAPAAPAEAAPVIEDSTTPTALETIAPALEPAAPASPTTMPGNGLTPSATAAPGAKIPQPGRLVGDQDPRPYPNLPNGKVPFPQ